MPCSIFAAKWETEWLGSEWAQTTADLREAILYAFCIKEFSGCTVHRTVPEHFILKPCGRCNSCMKEINGVYRIAGKWQHSDIKSWLLYKSTNLE